LFHLVWYWLVLKAPIVHTGTLNMVICLLDNMQFYILFLIKVCVFQGSEHSICHVWLDLCLHTCNRLESTEWIVLKFYAWEFYYTLWTHSSLVQIE
jgi:hypothetical protein